jgi:hypothetical protein
LAKAEASVEELVGMIERGELRLPEMQRRYSIIEKSGQLVFEAHCVPTDPALLGQDVPRGSDARS